MLYFYLTEELQKLYNIIVYKSIDRPDSFCNISGGRFLKLTSTKGSELSLWPYQVTPAQLNIQAAHNPCQDL